MKKTAWISGIFAAVLFCTPAQAQNMIEALPGEDPLNTVPVPPADAYDGGPAKIDNSWMEYKDPYLQAQQILSNPHRTSEEVSEWLKGLAADLMTHTPEDIESKIRGYRHVFSEKGWREYITYMTEAKVLDMVNLRKNQMSTIASSEALFVGSGATSGVYSWSAQLPLLISFFQPDMDGGQRQVAGGQFRLDAVIIRSSDEKAPEGMVIDSWRMSRISLRQ